MKLRGIPLYIKGYAIAHLALSWIYDGYSNGSDLWGGAPSSMVSDTKDMVDDLKNLPDPPEDYEVFWRLQRLSEKNWPSKKLRDTAVVKAEVQ